jgi:membrane protease YdiL (CAAX protease family)
VNSDPQSNSEEQPSNLAPYASPRLVQTDQADDLVDAELIQVNPPRLSWGGIAAWSFVILITVFLFMNVAYSQVATKPQVGGDASPKDLMQVQLQAKAIVGQKRMGELSGQPLPESTNQVPEGLDEGPYEQRLCYAILVSEIEGPAAAIEYLGELKAKVDDHDLELTEDQVQMRDALSGLFSEYENEEFEGGDFADGTTGKQSRDLIESKLKWIGQLAFLPEGTTRKTERQSLLAETDGLMIVGVLSLLVGGLGCLLGIGIAITALALLTSGRLKSKFANSIGDHNIYIETFAIWMAMFFGSSIVLSIVGIPSALVGMALQPIVFFGSLVALAWPVIRGISFQQVRQDIGWTADRPLIESLLSVPTYLATLPFLIPGIALVSILTSVVAGFHEPQEFGRPIVPGHPVQDYIQAGGLPMILLIFLTACVAAPIVEETMFRGVLYRHLRDWSSGWRRSTSVMLSAIINGLIFASIHPQGIYGIPVLATLAIGFSLAREWRNSLIGSMTMHAIHNTAITCVSLLIL